MPRVEPKKNKKLEIQLLHHVFIGGVACDSGTVHTLPLAEANYMVNNGRATIDIVKANIPKKGAKRPLTASAQRRKDQREEAMALTNPDVGKAIAAAEKKAEKKIADAEKLAAAAAERADKAEAALAAASK